MIFSGMIAATSTVVFLATCTGLFAQTSGGTGAEDESAPAKPSQLFRDNVPPPAHPAPQAPAPRAKLPAPVSVDAPHLHPVPEPGAEAEATKLLRDLFADEYQKVETSPEAAKALAAEMLRQAQELRHRNDRDDLASRFVLLRESVALSAGARDYTAALSAADALGDAFAIDVARLKLDLLFGAARDPAAALNAESLLRAYFELVDDAVSAGDFAGAASILSQAEALARKSKNVGLATDWQKRRKEVRDLQAEFRNLADASQTFQKDTGDAAANLIVGRFQCLVAGNWDAGLPMLVKGTDERLRTLAFRDLEGPADAAARAELAEDWWSLAEEQQHSRIRNNLRERAAFWYRVAVPDLTGLKRALALKRIEAVGIVGGAALAGAGGGNRQPAKPQAAGGDAQPGGQLLEQLARKFPAELGPVANVPWTPVKADEWFRTNVPAGTRITATATLAHSGGLHRDPTTKKPYVTLVFRTADPIDLNGLRYQLDVQAKVEDEKAMDAVKLARGQSGQLSGTINRCGIAGWSFTKDNQLKDLAFVLLLDNCQFIPAAE